MKLLTGNEALALGALRAGVKVVTGYPGTPSSRAIGSLLEMEVTEVGEGRHIEWSTNEKVAFEIAAGAAWGGQRALCTMKMSGLNVAADSIYSIAYSGVRGGLVIYVADDSGVSAGMCEQDSRTYARMFDLPMLEPATVAETYRLVPLAFDLSERVGTPVFVRLVTAVSNSHAPVVVEKPVPPEERPVVLERDITRYTKAGAAICMHQHRDVIARLAQAGSVVREMGLNEWRPAAARGGLGIIACGVTAAYLPEGMQIAARYGLDPATVSVLRVVLTNPLLVEEVHALLDHCDTVLVLEELEPHLEQQVYIEARRVGFAGRIVGKLDGPASLSRVGAYDVRQVVEGIGAALDLPLPADMFARGPQAGEAEALAAARPITVCAGCPHRGTFMALNQAIRRSHLKRNEVMVTGDIGCTILGMNPPFDTVWNEVSMGASIGIAQGYVHAGAAPVIATIGDSTFFHAGIPSLVNAVQHQVPLMLIIMDNGWTSMTGMQINPGTDEAFQPVGNRRVDIAKLIPALGVEHFFVVDPFDLDATRRTMQEALKLPGVKVILARQECAIQAQRRGEKAGRVRVLPEKCVLCNVCIRLTGCPAIELGAESILIDQTLCYGCGLCAQVCPQEAIEFERME